MPVVRPDRILFGKILVLLFVVRVQVGIMHWQVAFTVSSGVGHVGGCAQRAKAKEGGCGMINRMRTKLRNCVPLGHCGP